MAKNLKDIYVGVKKNDENRIAHDAYFTPPVATYVLHKYGNVPKKVIEPCAGRGAISKELIRNGYDVLSYDLNDHEGKYCDITVNSDVMELKKIESYDALVTNPPYHKDLPRKIMEKGILEYEYTALFVRLTFLEGQKRKKIFNQHPPSQIIFLSDRIQFKQTEKEPIEREDQIGGMIAYMWILWDLREKQNNNTKLTWVNASDEYDEWRKKYDESIK